MLPASLKGRDGMDELSKQVVALFSSGTPPRKVFPDGLAFDLLPAVGEPGEDGWTSREIRVREQLRRMLGVQWPMHITLVGVPVFSGISAQISIRSARQVPADLAERVLADAGVVFPETSGVRYLPRPRRVEGQPFVHAARTRNSEDGSSLHVWAGLDNLRGAATAAVAVGGALLRHR